MMAEEMGIYLKKTLKHLIYIKHSELHRFHRSSPFAELQKNQKFLPWSTSTRISIVLNTHNPFLPLVSFLMYKIPLLFSKQLSS